MKTDVLIPLDGSEFSQAVLDEVEKLFSPERYRLTLLRVAAVPDELNDTQTEVLPGLWNTNSPSQRNLEQSEPLAGRSAYLDSVWDRLRAEMLADLAKAQEQLERSGFEVELRVRFGDAAQEIIDFTELKEFDVVAMATHGRTGLGRMLMGSVAERVLHSVHVPVLMVRPASVLADETLPLTRFAIVNLEV